PARSWRIRTSQRRARRDRSHGWPPEPRYNNTASRAASSRPGYVPHDVAHVKGLARAFFTGRAACGEVPLRALPHSAPHRIAGRCAGVWGGPKQTGPDCLPTPHLATLRAHHDGCAPPAGRGALRVAADPAPRRCGGGPTAFPGGGLLVVSQGGG